ncbi:hypothetical protein [Pacificibacter marinus]|uniref:Uncharacterized protein n=1 Tax=Pacificibacter marinus TaxID=658057 RepID=A0A1Y5RUG8_9RHOB|nr:hypothetical protein [Pacificibacter marinus]SEK41606.1 hypothetical protein SAMN04488032_102256 [Pacificibacter marinus]SLN24694.1 hypothetical protein PAM7971_00830 [Pacificibacter marinus]
MQVLKVWGFAGGLFGISVLASTLHLSAALPNKAAQAKGLSPTGIHSTQSPDRNLLDHIPMVQVNCTRPHITPPNITLPVTHTATPPKTGSSNTHHIAYCALNLSAQ